MTDIVTVGEPVLTQCYLCSQERMCTLTRAKHHGLYAVVCKGCEDKWVGQ